MRTNVRRGHFWRACPALVLGATLLLIASNRARADLNVVASIKPVHSLVAGVMRGAGDPALLIERGSPHSYALKPSNARALQNADLVVWIGPTLETFLKGPLTSLASKALILPLSKAKWLTLHEMHSERTRPRKHGHRQKPKTIDPHIWLDPQNARAFVIEIATALAKKDPVHKSLYWTNARQMISRLDDLTHQIDRQLSALRDRPYLTFHDDFQYFERRFNLNYAGSIALAPERQSGARHLRVLQEKIRNQQIKCVFSEPQFQTKLVAILIEGTSARTGVLDPLGATIKKGPEHYFSLLKNNAASFATCLRD